MQSVSSYEIIQYPSRFFTYTNPGNLAVLGTLFGMQPPDVKKCRVLELGCGDGSNLLTYAFDLPDSEFIGIDLAKSHIAEANKSAQILGLTNIKFYELDLMKMSAGEFGKFDYIIAHGLLSWVPDLVRERVLQIYDEMLAQNGVGYISYNVYPGNHLREISQNMMKFFAAKSSDPMEKVNNAISFLNFLTNENSGPENFRSILQSELKTFAQKRAADIIYDDLFEDNQSFYFHEFAAEIQQHGLQFLCEAEPHLMSVQSFTPQARAFINSRENIIEREQHIDFLSCRFFRRSLVCHNDIALNRLPEPLVLDKFMMVSSIRPASENPDLISREAEKFIGINDVGFEIEQPLTKMSLFLLQQQWAKAISFVELLNDAKQLLKGKGVTSKDWENEFNIARTIFLQIYLNTNLIGLRLHEPAIKTEIPETPEIHKLARWQIAKNVEIWTLFNLNFKADEPVVKYLLELMDGTRNKEDLLKSLEEFVKTNEEIDNRKEILEKLPNWLETNLSLMARIGMFV